MTQTKQEAIGEKKVKTTIDVPEDLWKRFSIKVIQEYGGRKKNDVIKELLEEYLRKKGT